VNQLRVDLDWLSSTCRSRGEKKRKEGEKDVAAESVASRWNLYPCSGRGGGGGREKTGRKPVEVDADRRKQIALVDGGEG